MKDTLDDMSDLLNEDGRLGIITFHSLEDRIVKVNFKKNEKSMWLQLFSEQESKETCLFRL